MPGPAVSDALASLDDDARGVVTSIVRSSREWLSSSAIASALRRESSVVDAIVGRLHAEGYVDIWAKRSGTVVTLTSWGAGALGFELIERKRKATEDPGSVKTRFRWAKRKKGSGLPPRLKRPKRQQSAELLDDFGESEPDPMAQVVDESPGPEALAIFAEAEAARAEETRLQRERKGQHLRLEDLPRPQIVHTGHAGLEWSEKGHKPRHALTCKKCRHSHRRQACSCGRPARDPRRSPQCLRCHDGHLPNDVVCADCLRWGRLEPVVESDQPKPQAKSA
jgi:hypothetical protein